MTLKLKDIEAISEYYDGEVKDVFNLQEKESLIKSNEEAQKFYSNLPLISQILQNGNKAYLVSIEKDLNSFWNVVNTTLSKEDELLNNLLKSSLDELPDEFANIDIWSQLSTKLSAKLNNEELLDPTIISSAQNNSIISSNIPFRPVDENWEIILQQSYELPNELKEINIWDGINQKLNEKFHEEFFSENAHLDWSDKTKFYIGLFEYLDGETSGAKTQEINNHLNQCPSCRETYLPFTKSRQALKYSFSTNNQASQDQDEFWSEIESKLFPEENKFQFKKIQGL
jgi:hypothetical protein